MQISNETKAEILVQALPYIKKYTGEIIVIKYVGNLSGGKLEQGVMKDVVLLDQIGVKVVLVHGGYPDGAAACLSQKLDELKKSNAEAAGSLEIALVNKTNKDIVGVIGKVGGNAVGLCGADGRMLEVSSQNGSVVIDKIDVAPLENILAAGAVPVVCAVGTDADGKLYQMNVDMLAARLAGALKAKCLINMADQKGVLRDKNDASSLIPVLNVSEVPRLVKDGVIDGDMLPKADCCVEAIRRGVKQVFIIDGTVPHSILVEILSDEGIGTMFV